MGRITKEEQIVFQGAARETLFTLTGGDLRKSVTLLQMAHSLAKIQAGKADDVHAGQITIGDSLFYQLSSRMDVSVLIKFVTLLTDASEAAQDALFNFIQG